MITELSGKYRFLSNFWSCYILYRGSWYPSVENAYQAAKMYRSEDREKFENIKASDAKKQGKVLPMRGDWNVVRTDVMYELVLQKFRRYKELANQLDLTGHQEIEEGNWWGDTFWGTCNGIGENQLGKILMRVREHIRSEPRKWDELEML